MSETADKCTPIACALPEEEMRVRRAELTQGLWQKIGAVRELADGYAFGFETRPGVMAELEEFIAFERACCSFMTYAIEDEPGVGSVWLKLTGPEGTKEFLRGWLPDERQTAKANG